MPGKRRLEESSGVSGRIGGIVDIRGLKRIGRYKGSGYGSDRRPGEGIRSKRDIPAGEEIIGDEEGISGDVELVVVEEDVGIIAVKYGVGDTELCRRGESTVACSIDSY